MALSKIRSDSMSDAAIQSNRNLIINGNMQVAQRGTSLAMAHDGTTNGYLIDRWRFTFGGSLAHSALAKRTGCTKK